MAKLVSVGQDFLESVKGHKVVCFEILVCERKFILKKGHTKADFSEVIKSMLRYKAFDSKISGTIWCKKGIWFSHVCKERVYTEDDGWKYIYGWAKYSCPQIPDYLSGFVCAFFIAFCGYSGCPLKINRSSLAGMIHSIEKEIKHVSTYIVNSCYLKNLVINIKTNIIMKEK